MQLGELLCKATVIKNDSILTVFIGENDRDYKRGTWYNPDILVLMDYEIEYYVVKPDLNTILIKLKEEENPWQAEDIN